MPRPNTRAASFIDVTLHQAARRDALSLGLIPYDTNEKKPTLKERFINWAGKHPSGDSLLLAVLSCIASAVLFAWYVTP